VLVYSLLCELLLVAIFSFSQGYQLFYQPVSGGPSLGGILTLTLLPLTAAYLLTIPASTTEVSDKPEAAVHTQLSSLPRVFWKFLLVILIFTFATSAIRGLFISFNTPEAAKLDFSMIVLYRAIFAVALLLLTVRWLTRVSFGKIYLVLMVIIAIILTLSPLMKIYSPALTSLVGFVGTVFDFIVWCLLAFIVFEKQLPAILVYGFGRGVLMAGSALGWLVSYRWLPSIIGSNWEYVFYVALALVILISTTLVFTEKDFDKLFTAIAQRDTDIDDLLPAATAEHLRMEEERNERRPWLVACRSVGETARLSTREQEIMELLALNRGSEDIAKRISVSLNTVRTHTHNIYAKLDVHSRQELVDLVAAERDRQESR